MQDVACDSFFDEFLIDEHKLTVSLLEVSDPNFTSLFTSHSVGVILNDSVDMKVKGIFPDTVILNGRIKGCF